MKEAVSRTGAMLLGLALLAGGCLVTADESLWRRCPQGPCHDAVTTAPERGSPGEPRPDVPRPLEGGRAERSPETAPKADLGLPDQLATYTRHWQTVTLSTHPGRLWGPKLVYDSDKALVLLYGGAEGLTAVARSWSYQGTGWQPLCTSCPPGPRVGHGMVYDQARKVVVLFGGHDGTNFKNDLWELGGGVWKKITLLGGPSPRAGVLMAYDSNRARTVVFGGVGDNDVFFDQVFEYDGAGWKGPLTPPVRPPARDNSGSAAIFADSRALSPAFRDRVVIFGGATLPDETGPLDDCWVWDGATWTPVCTACTGTPRSAAGLTYDVATGRAVLINGYTGKVSLAGTLEHQGILGWKPTSNLPGARDSSGVAFDVKRNRLVLFGGNGPACGGDCQETLEYVAP